MELLIALAFATSLGVPGRANATPSIAADGDFVAIVWSASTPAGSTDIYAAVSRDAARTFAPPVRVNDVDGDARVNGEQPPRVALVSDGARRASLVTPQIVVVWTTKGAAGTKLVQSQSTDGGRSFATATTVAGSDAAGNRGWEAIAAESPGASSGKGSLRVYALWLDHRAMAHTDAEAAVVHHQHGVGQPDGVAMAQLSKLYFAPLDGSSPPRAVTGGVCYCCKTALVAGSAGSIYAAWRHVYPGNIRDIAFSVSRDGGRTFDVPARVSEDKWVLDGCPDDGPAMTVDAANRIHIVWPTLVPDAADEAATVALFYATSEDGRRFTARQRIPTEGVAHHPQMAAAADGSLAVVWDESSNGSRRAVVARARVDASGRAHVTREVVSGRDAAVYPVVTIAGEAAVVAWTSGSAGASRIGVVRRPDRELPHSARPGR